MGAKPKPEDAAHDGLGRESDEVILTVVDRAELLQAE
jgi:hypothetical protein